MSRSTVETNVCFEQDLKDDGIVKLISKPETEISI